MAGWQQGAGIATPTIALPRANMLDTLFGRPHDVASMRAHVGAEGASSERPPEQQIARDAGEYSGPAIDAARTGAHATVFDGDEAAPESHTDDAGVAHITAVEKNTSPPRFPGSKQLGFTEIPHENDLRGLQQPRFFVHTTAPTSEGEQASTRVRALRAAVDGTVNVYVVQPGEHWIGEKDVQVQHGKQKNVII